MKEHVEERNDAAPKCEKQHQGDDDQYDREIIGSAWAYLHARHLNTWAAEGGAVHDGYGASREDAGRWV